MTDLHGGIEASTWQRVCAALRAHPAVGWAVLYGSRAMGRQHRGSDIDLTLIPTGGWSLRNWHGIMQDLDELMLPYAFDVAPLTSIRDESVLDHIQRVGRIVYDQDVPCQDAPPWHPADGLIRRLRNRSDPSTTV